MTANKPPVLAAIELLERINKFGRINKGISRDRVKEITKRSKAALADLQKWVDDEDWFPMETAPKDKTIFYVKESYRVPFRWKPYRPKRQKIRHGVKGRWQEMNEYGGWVNSNKKPDKWQPDTPTERG